MSPPGKTNYIGTACVQSERYKDLVARTFSLKTARDSAAFMRRVSPYASREAYEKWRRAYETNAGSFVDHVCWGADRDLGDGEWLYGAMDDRFASNAARVFVPEGLDSSRHVENKSVCVVGAWDATECLLMRALSAKFVDAVDEVPAFCDMARAQYDAWDIPGNVYEISLFEVDVKQLWQKYDLLYVPGVLYHLTDLIAATVIMWSMLKTGGVLAVESIADIDKSRTTRYVGTTKPGWNWWSPTTTCYRDVMVDCGFPDARVVESANGRCWWVGTRSASLPVLSAGVAGFSRPDVMRTVRNLMSTERT